MDMSYGKGIMDDALTAKTDRHGKQSKIVIAAEPA
jgi:hypothetical protein